MNQVARKEAEVMPAPTTEATAIIAMIERAATNPAVDIDKMERLMKMHTDMLARNAKSAYAAALAQMQPELPIITKRGQIKIGNGKPQTYALWEDINEQIKPVLARHGFSLWFRTGQQDSKIIVTGILSHRDGHSEETTMHLPIDNSGSKNAVQAVGSSTSYGKRYTAAALLNLTSRGEDDDGKTAAGGFITDEQVGELVALIEDAGGNKADALKRGFLKYMRIETLADLPAAKLKDGIAAIEAKRSN